MEKRYFCDNCGKGFSKQAYYIKHVENKSCETDKRYVCLLCGSTFASKYNLRYHEKLTHSLTGGGDRATQVYLCGLCDRRFSSSEDMQEHRKIHGQALENAKSFFGFNQVATAHKKTFELFRYTFPDNVHFVSDAFEEIWQPLQNFFTVMHFRHRMFKAALILHLEFIKLDETAEVENIIVAPFRSAMYTVYPFMEVEPILIDSMFELINNVEKFTQSGSGWALNDVLFMDVELAACRPLAGGCNLHEVQYRRNLGIHVTDKGFDSPMSGGAGDQTCFFLAVANHFRKTDDACVLFVKDKMKVDIDVPVKIKDICKFESDNVHLDISVNVVYMNEDKEVYPVCVSKNIKAKNVITLLLLAVESPNENEDPLTFHYVYVSDPLRLLSTRNKNSDTGVTQRTRKGLLCYNCFNMQYSMEAHENHVRWCHEKTGQVVHYPRKGDVMHFAGKNMKRAKVGYTVFFDFETLQVTPANGGCNCDEATNAMTKYVKSLSRDDLEQFLSFDYDERELCQPDGKKRRTVLKVCTHKTKVLKEHHAFSYALILVDRFGTVVEEHFYVGTDAVVNFLEKMIDIEKRCLSKLKNPVPMKLTEEDRKDIATATDCYLCKMPLSTGSRKVCRDHDHLTGRYLGMTHDQCNLERREQEKIVAQAWNFAGYDSHLILKDIGKLGDKIYDIQAIPLNTQKFKMLTINKIIFLDSLAFLQDSLEKAVDTLVKSDHSFPLLKQRKWADVVSEGASSLTESECRQLLLRKGVYPYMFATSISRLEQMTELPGREHFFHEIGEEPVSEQDYEHAKRVWTAFGCSNMLDYTKIYNLSDSYLAAEAIYDLRNSIYEEYQLDICNYLSLPMLTRDLMLKKTQARIELITNIEMSKSLQHNIRGGLSYIARRYVNIAEMNEQRKLHGKPSLTMIYVDANNLYGKGMSFCLPLRNFRWMTERELRAFTPNMILDEEGPGYILEVSLKYPKSLHRLHSSYPLAPEHAVITHEDLSPYARECLKVLGKSVKYKAHKLISSVRDRTRYWTHGLNLKLYLELGLELVEIHRGITFFQAPFVRSYIDWCTEKRRNAKTKSESNRAKLLSCSLYGKFIEAVSGRMDCKFNRSEIRASARAVDPTYRGHTILDDNTSVTFHAKRQMRIKQSWAIGFSVLELSKYFMQHLFYKEIRPALDDKVEVLFTDTDSFLLLAEASDPGTVMSRLAHVVDTSNYPPEHPLYDPSRKNETGYLKNELPGTVNITEFIGLKAKTYAFKTDNNEMEARAKGVKKCYKKKIKFEEFKKCLFTIDDVQVRQTSIRSVNHQNMLVQSVKSSMTSFDDKRFLTCPLHSLPYGSFLIDEYKRTGKCYHCCNPFALG